MKGTVIILLCACVAMVRAIPMHHDSSEEKDPSMMIYKMFGGNMGRGKKCHDPMPMFTEMYSLICDTKNCSTNAPKCVTAMTPSGDMCEMQRDCMHELRPTKNKKERPTMKMMMECMCEKMMTSMNLTYVKDDIKGNAMKMLEATIGQSKDIPDKTKIAVMNAVSEDTCPAPTGDYMMMDKMKFSICVLKTCVRSMAL